MAQLISIQERGEREEPDQERGARPFLEVRDERRGSGRRTKTEAVGGRERRGDLRQERMLDAKELEGYQRS